jgi:hypothetical protein
MKRFFGLLFLILLLNGCDDGDVTVQNISFADIPTSNTCGDIVYKIKGNEAMIIKITNASTIAFMNTLTPSSTPTSIAIGGTTRVIYRNYNGVPSGANICDSPPAATPSVTEEWNAIGGTIEVTTTANKTTNTTTNATTITGYNHYIVFKNINFQKPVGTQVYEAFVFGNYTTATALTYPFNSAINITKCPSVNTISALSGVEGLVINNLETSLIQQVPTTTPRTGNLSATTNTLSYKIYNATIPVGFFCGTATTPVIKDHWDPDYTATTGTIEVTTTVVGSGTAAVYTHKIHLKNVTLKNATTPAQSFYLGDDCYYGDLIQ